MEHDTRVVAPDEADHLITGYLALLDRVALRSTARLSRAAAAAPALIP